jgi:hypothetical protein
VAQLNPKELIDKWSAYTLNHDLPEEPTVAALDDLWHQAGRWLPRAVLGSNRSRLRGPPPPDRLRQQTGNPGQNTCRQPQHRRLRVSGGP